MKFLENNKIGKKLLSPYHSNRSHEHDGTFSSNHGCIDGGG